MLLLQIAVLLAYYRQLAQQEKLEKEKKKFCRRRSYLHLSVSCAWCPGSNCHWSNLFPSQLISGLMLKTPWKSLNLTGQLNSSGAIDTVPIPFALTKSWNMASQNKLGARLAHACDMQEVGELTLTAA